MKERDDQKYYINLHEIIISCNNKMAFEVAKSTDIQIDPTFMQGYPYPAKYHNVGQLMTPYEGKKMGQGGDYASPQSTVYYTPDNPVYPYPLDRFFNSDIHPIQKSCCCTNSEYPWRYIPGNYFVPLARYPDMGKVKSAPYFNTYPLGTHPDFHVDEDDYYPRRKKERYGDPRAYSEADPFLYRRLPTAPGPELDNANYYPPFNNFY
uniref:Uncharacterized protein n=1 Tax=Marseillevirus LCMAC101 TaxID=2506602 RepID=A0A481YT50_9VIRU|nr:MAG: hypothetical protein LCMAC101_02690 [Marseillevirus LCMAC101]